MNRIYSVVPAVALAFYGDRLPLYHVLRGAGTALKAVVGGLRLLPLSHLPPPGWRGGELCWGGRACTFRVVLMGNPSLRQCRSRLTGRVL
jgi:hypothetical protein